MITRDAFGFGAGGRRAALAELLKHSEHPLVESSAVTDQEVLNGLFTLWCAWNHELTDLVALNRLNQRSLSNE